MIPSQRARPLIIIVIATLILFGTGIFFWERSSPDFDPTKRPGTGKYLFDYAGLLGDQDDYTNLSLKKLEELYSLEALILTLEELPDQIPIEEFSSDLFSAWKIGQNSGQRGVLLLLINKTKEVKLEISYELEDVFTDLFCGAAEDLHLQPYFKQGGLEIGLLAVMEELEKRAELKHLGNYTKEQIANLDLDFGSGGGGAKRNVEILPDGASNKVPPASAKEQTSIYTDSYHLALGTTYDSRFPAGKTVEEAYQIYLKERQARAKQGDRYAKRDVQERLGKDYKIISNGKNAVVSFGKEWGWDNTPLLFAKTSSGWQFDIVSMRKYVRMGNAPKWGVEHTDNPYVNLLQGFPYFMGIDLPLEPEDRYYLNQDTAYVTRIRKLEEEYQKNPGNFSVALELGTLATITSRRPWHTFKPLNQAKKLRPEDPRPYKQLAIKHVSSSYQYEKAIVEFKNFLRLKPQSFFGHASLGYLYLLTDKNEKALKELNLALKIKPGCYIYSKVAQANSNLYKSCKYSLNCAGYLDAAKTMYTKTGQSCGKKSWRYKKLKRWMRKKNLLKLII